MINKVKRNSKSSSRIGLTFNQAVTVRKSFYNSLSYSELFSALGGTLGLWLGVGIMQIIEHLANCRNIVNNVIKVHWIKVNKDNLIQRLGGVEFKSAKKRCFLELFSVIRVTKFLDVSSFIEMKNFKSLILLYDWNLHFYGSQIQINLLIKLSF